MALYYYTPAPTKVYAQPSAAARVQGVVNQISDVGLGAYGLSQAKTIGDYVSSIYQVLSGVTAATPYGPAVQIESLVMGTLAKLVDQYVAKQEATAAKRHADRKIENYGVNFAEGVQRGQGPAFAARMAAAGIGVEPELVFPLGAPPGVPTYNPLTRAADSPRGLAVYFGEGPGAEAVRREYADEINADQARRPYPGEGMTIQPFARRRRQ